LPTGAESFTEAMKMGSETYHHLKKVINKKYGIDGEYRGLIILSSHRPSMLTRTRCLSHQRR
jgi:hypothetical protein